MTNRQWLIWQMIDMSDEELIKKYPKFMCDVCDEHITPKMLCPGDCDPLLLAWLQKEQEED